MARKTKFVKLSLDCPDCGLLWVTGVWTRTVNPVKPGDVWGVVPCKDCDGRESVVISCK